MKDFSDQFKEPNLVKICGNCAKDYRLNNDKIKNAGWEPTHGVCSRHFISYFKTAGIPDDKIKNRIDSLKEPLCADLNDPNNKRMLDWLSDPTPHSNN